MNDMSVSLSSRMFSLYLFIYLSIYLSIHPSIHPSIYLQCLFARFFIDLHECIQCIHTILILSLILSEYICIYILHLYEYIICVHPKTPKTGGVWSGHAYTILRLLDVPITRNGKSITLQLMHVRNPHATNETRCAKGRMGHWKGGWRYFFLWYSMTAIPSTSLFEWNVRIHMGSGMEGQVARRW